MLTGSQHIFETETLQNPRNINFLQFNFYLPTQNLFKKTLRCLQTNKNCLEH